MSFQIRYTFAHLHLKMLAPVSEDICHERASTDTEEKKLLNEDCIFVFFAHKKFSYLHKIPSEPLMSHGLFNQSPY